MHLDRRACDRARRSRDPRFDGRFFIAVTTTRIYCRPVCPARAPKDANIRYFPTAAAAEAAGYRPCLRCRPEAAPGTPAWAGTSAVVSRALGLIEEGALDEAGVARLAERVGVTDRHLRRLFLQHLGAAPLQVALTRRAHAAKLLLDQTSLSCADIAAAAGFGSLRRFNSHIRRTYQRSPSDIRRLARQHSQNLHASNPRASNPRALNPRALNLRALNPRALNPRALNLRAEPPCFRFRLSFRPPFDWSALVAFLRARATPGVESVDERSYRRTIGIDGAHGTIAIARADEDAIAVEVRFPEARRLLGVVERVRAMFDLGADPALIAEHLGGDRGLAALLKAHPGIRVAGAWDGFELAVRAIVGQQISVAAATTMAGRIARLFGTPLPAGGLDRLFPTPAQLVDAPLERAGLVKARAAAIRALARLVAGGAIVFDRSRADEDVIRMLLECPGIGPWTAHYIAMRAFGRPDAFPSGDLVLRRMAGRLSARELDRRAEAWRPWRAYAVMLLWQAAVDEVNISGRKPHDSSSRRAARDRGARALRDSAARAGPRRPAAARAGGGDSLV